MRKIELNKGRRGQEREKSKNVKMNRKDGYGESVVAVDTRTRIRDKWKTYEESMLKKRTNLIEE